MFYFDACKTFLLLQLLLSTMNLISGELKARNSCISVWTKIFTFESIATQWFNLTQEIQFLEFMGGSNLTHAHSNDLICMCFIRINTVYGVIVSS